MITDILPQELVLHIFKFLDYEAIYFMNMVSTYFNYLIKNNLKYICNSMKNKEQKDFHIKKQEYLNLDFNILRILNLYNLEKVRQTYLEDPSYNLYYEKEACIRGFRFYRNYKFLVENSMIEEESYRKCMAMKDNEMEKFILAKKGGFSDLWALKLADIFSKEEIKEAIKIREQSNYYEAQIIEMVTHDVGTSQV